jgi:aldehyde dehydrogenase (NAD+)
MKELVSKQQQFFSDGTTRSVDFRKKKLRELKFLLQKNEQEFFQALHADFQKPAFETFETELMMIYQEIDHLLSNISGWASPKKVSGSWITFPSKNYIHSQPYGVSLVIGAWNYPLQLTINPALGSMAAGNCTILKPSEIASNTAGLLANIINNNFDAGFLHVVEGNAEVTQSLLHQPLDYIFFTGSKRVGKIVMKAAAEQLTPLTLELGGKSPAIVDRSADLQLAAKRIAWGKFINAGQTCVSPDYVYVHENDCDRFCELVHQHIKNFYGDDPSQSPDYARIINQKHFNRLVELIDSSKVRYGGRTIANERYIEPTVLADISWNDDIMQEEIFGPLLPVLSYRDMGDVISAVNAHPHPLALYLFTTDKSLEQRITNNVPFGGGCINDTISHLANLDLPFGGIGQSGFGSYHGKASFDTFSQKKSVMKKGSWLDIPLRYPPYEGKFEWLKKITKYL